MIIISSGYLSFNGYLSSYPVTFNPLIFIANLSFYSVILPMETRRPVAMNQVSEFHLLSYCRHFLCYCASVWNLMSLI